MVPRGWILMTLVVPWLFNLQLPSKIGTIQGLSLQQKVYSWNVSVSLWYTDECSCENHQVCCYFQVDTDELYDVVNYKTKRTSGVSVQAMRTLWDSKSDQHSDHGNTPKIQQQNDAMTPSPALPPPALPPKSRKLTGAVSVDTVSLSQVRWKWELNLLLVLVCWRIVLYAETQEI